MNRLLPSDKQQRVLDLLLDYHSKGQSPTFVELMDDLGYKSTNSVYQIMQSLVRKGYLVKRGEVYVPAPNEYFITQAQRDQLTALFTETVDALGKQLIKNGNDKKSVAVYKDELRSRFESVFLS